MHETRSPRKVCRLGATRQSGSVGMGDGVAGEVSVTIPYQAASNNEHKAHVLDFVLFS
jgi:hypothetical protein